MTFTTIIDHCIKIFDAFKAMASTAFTFLDKTVSFPYLDLSNIKNPSLEYVNVAMVELMFGASVYVIIVLMMSKFIMKWF